MKLRGALVAALLLVSTHAYADEPNARELAKQGYELFVANKCDEAIPLLKRSAELAPDSRTFVNLGRCEDKTNHLVAALEHFKAAREVGRDSLNADMLVKLEAMATEVDARIPRVKLALAPNAPAATVVKRNDVEIPRATLEAGVAVDPGEVTFIVSAPGYEPKSFLVTIAEGHTQSLTVTPGLPVAPKRPLLEPPSNEPNRSPLKTVGVITMIAGGAALAVGGVLGAVALGKKGNAEDAGCIDRQCPDGNAANFRNDAKSAGTASTIFFIGGGVLAAAGFGMFLFAPSASREHAGLTMSGRF